MLSVGCLLFFFSIGMFAQQQTVKGVVKDVTGEPIIGASVLVKGTNNGTITNLDGAFLSPM
ncbi:carboxypeptidase-like regulatory domain-containing protein [Bacteroides sp. CR5/BHMF/2]|nr:carboxypeptidase-like regulatory domain-containing protein [Bacteroides sp. CR5/BHMF/2]